MNDEQAMWRVQMTDCPEAFAELMRRWQGPIQNLCVRMTGDVHRAEDLAQEAFTKVFTKRKNFQHGARFSTWLWRIAVNLCLDEKRRANRRGEEPWPEDEEHREPMVSVLAPQPDVAVAAGEQAEMVRQALLELPDHYRTVLVLRHYEGLKFGEIAEVTGLPEGTVKSRMAEGLNLLQRKLQRTRLAEAQLRTGGHRSTTNLICL